MKSEQWHHICLSFGSPFCDYCLECKQLSSCIKSQEENRRQDDAGAKG